MRTLKTKGEYKGFNYMIYEMSNQIESWYCAYVEIPEDHPLYNTKNVDLPIDKELTWHGDIDGKYYIGFDTGHVGYTPETHGIDYCVETCKEIIDCII